jgi:hypothetical protein
MTSSWSRETLVAALTPKEEAGLQAKSGFYKGGGERVY